MTPLNCQLLCSRNKTSNHIHQQKQKQKEKEDGETVPDYVLYNHVIKQYHAQDTNM